MQRISGAVGILALLLLSLAACGSGNSGGGGSGDGGQPTPGSDACTGVSIVIDLKKVFENGAERPVNPMVQPIPKSVETLNEGQRLALGRDMGSLYRDVWAYRVICRGKLFESDTRLTQVIGPIEVLLSSGESWNRPTNILLLRGWDYVSAVGQVEPDLTVAAVRAAFKFTGQ